MTQTTPNSPRISHLSWGRIEVEGHPPFKDAKVFPGGARAWDWNETGTRHTPGIQPVDVQELIEHGAKAVVLSKGIWERIQVSPETLEVLANNGIEVDIAVAQGEAQVQPNRVPDHIWREAVAGVGDMPESSAVRPRAVG